MSPLTIQLINKVWCGYNIHNNNNNNKLCKKKGRREREREREVCDKL